MPSRFDADESFALFELKFNLFVDSADYVRVAHLQDFLVRIVVETNLADL
jgi:hypothetical protein